MDLAAAAIADPTRRQILTVLRDAPQTAGALAARFPISRPAVSRHLRVLRQSGLVDDTQEGRERVYVLTPEPLRAIADWVASLRPTDSWTRNLAALDTEVRRTVRDHRPIAESNPAR